MVGSGWWEAELHEYVAAHGAGASVVFEGHVDEEHKHEVYERAWVLALPSLKEGWGLVIGEAGMHTTPTVAYRSAGGTQESVVDGTSGVLVDDQATFTATLGRLLDDADLRQQLGRGALEQSHRFTWSRAQQSFADVLVAVLSGRRVAGSD